MTSLSTDNSKKCEKGEYYRCWFDQLRDGNYRPFITLGFYKSTTNVKKVQLVLNDLEEVIRVHGKVDGKLRKRINDACDAKIIKRLEKKGLLKIKKPAITVSELFERYYKSTLLTIQPRSARHYRSALRAFGNWNNINARRIDTITASDLADFKTYCLEEIQKGKKRRSTIGNYFKRIKKAFEYAVDKGLLEKSPFPLGFKSVPIKRSEKHRKIEKELCTAEAIQELLDYSKENEYEWFALLMLVRLTGMRKAEMMILRKQDIKFEANPPVLEFRQKMSGDVSNREDMTSRQFPLFEVLATILKKVIEQSPKDSIHVFNNILGLSKRKREFDLTSSSTGEVIEYGRYSVDAGAELKKLAKRAGIKNMWPRPFHAIRTFRENELLRSRAYSPKAVFDWIGHTPQTALKHYLESDERDMHTAIRKEYRDNKVVSGDFSEKSVPNGCIRSGQASPKTHLVNDAETNTGEAGLNGHEWDGLAVSGISDGTPSRSSDSGLKRLLLQFLAEKCAHEVQSLTSDDHLLLTKLQQLLSKSGSPTGSLSQSRSVSSGNDKEA